MNFQQGLSLAILCPAKSSSVHIGWWGYRVPDFFNLARLLLRLFEVRGGVEFVFFFLFVAFNTVSSFFRMKHQIGKRSLAGWWKNGFSATFHGGAQR